MEGEDKWEAVFGKNGTSTKSEGEGISAAIRDEKKSKRPRKRKGATRNRGGLLQNYVEPKLAIAEQRQREKNDRQDLFKKKQEGKYICDRQG